MSMVEGVPEVPNAVLPDVLLRAIEATPHGITVADNSPERRIIYANAAFVRLSGYPLEEILGRRCDFLRGPDSDIKQIAAIREATDDGRAATAVITAYRRDMTPFWNEISVAAVRGSGGDITHFIAVQVDVTRRVECETELAHLAHSDPLTGLINRRQVMAQLDELLPLPAGEGLAVVVVDLDEFHRINEDFDFETGDLVLAGVAERLESITSPEDIIGRLGADRFVVIRRAQAAASETIARELVDAIHLVLRTPITTPEISIRVRASCGVALAPGDAGTSAGLLDLGRSRVSH